MNSGKKAVILKSTINRTLKLTKISPQSRKKTNISLLTTDDRRQIYDISFLDGEDSFEEWYKDTAKQTIPLFFSIDFD